MFLLVRIVREQQSAKADGFYFVNDGLFECIDDDGVVVKEFAKGDLFGELGVFLSDANEVRGLTVQSASPNASLHFVDTKDYNLIAQLKGSRDGDIMQSALKEEHSECVELLKKKKALMTFKPLRGVLNPNEFENVARLMVPESFADGDNITVEGSDGDEMHFVENGTYKILGIDGKPSNQQHFGEMSVFLRRPRAKTIQAEGKLSLFKLDRESLLSVIGDETRLENESPSLLADAHREAGFLDKVKEVNDYIVVKNRPKKELVSFHSTLATSATAMHLLGVVTCISPGFSPDGIPHLFDFDKFDLGLLATQLTTLLFAVVGVTGSFRLPPNTPRLRRHFFNCKHLCVVH